MAALGAAAWLTGCGGEPDPAADAGDASDSGTAPTVPSLREAFGDCETEARAGGLGRGDGLARVDVDLARFPDALCNDGTGAVFYVRRASEPASEHRWVLQLMGGGGCATPATCASRFCSVGTNFSAVQMSANYAPDDGGTAGGLQSATATNPFGTWNQVLVYYCSSDSWAGRRINVDATAPNPRDPSEMRDFRIHFAGAHIVDAVVETLRRPDGEALSYVMPGSTETETLPNLDDAEVVLFAGASAGSAGVTHHVDRLHARLRETNSACSGEACPLRFFGLHDSGYGPLRSSLDFSETTMCADLSLCDYASFQASRAEQEAMFQDRVGDDSCLAWHESNAPDMAYRCTDTSEVLVNHITTPIFVRMDQADPLQGAGLVEAGFRTAEGVPVDPTIFATIVREQMTGLADIQSTAREGGEITRVPGAFSPRCGHHETLRNNSDYRDVGIRVDGTASSFPEILQNWMLDSGGPTVAIAGDDSTQACPAD